MGYTTEYEGEIAIEPPLNAEEIAYFKKFNSTRRMKRGKGDYYVDGSGDFGQAREDDIEDYNSSGDMPSLWCGWTCKDDGSAIIWDGGEKFYYGAEWMAWIIGHLFGEEPMAKPELPFLQGHQLNGVMFAQGEEPDDMWKLTVKDNGVFTTELQATEVAGSTRSV